MRSALSLLTLLALAPSAYAQKAPETGYIYPPAGKAGTTVNVVLGVYDATPDMQFFVHDKRVKLDILGAPGEILIPPPPYWFGAKGRLTGPPLFRERSAKFVLPADLPAAWSGPVTVEFRGSLDVQPAVKTCTWAVTCQVSRTYVVEPVTIKLR